MTELPYRPEHVNDAIADTEELTNEELGAYVRLQRALWRAGGYLPVKELGRFARAGKRWGAIAPRILGKLLVIEGRASCPPLLATLLRTRDRREKAVERATAGAAARWGKSRSGGLAAQTLNYPLNGAISLKTLTVLHAASMPADGLPDANQNQKNIDLKNLSTVGTAAGGREGLYEEGSKILQQRVGLRDLAARSQISKWLAAAGDDAEVAALLASVERENLQGARLISVVDQGVKAAKTQRVRGGTLPFGILPNVIARESS